MTSTTATKHWPEWKRIPLPGLDEAKEGNAWFNALSAEERIKLKTEHNLISFADIGRYWKYHIKDKT